MASRLASTVPGGGGGGPSGARQPGARTRQSARRLPMADRASVLPKWWRIIGGGCPCSVWHLTVPPSPGFAGEGGTLNRAGQRRTALTRFRQTVVAERLSP